MREETSVRSCLNLMLNDATPYLLVIAMQFGSAGMFIVTTSTFHKGMNRYVFIAYRNAMAAVILAPFALFFERKVRPKMTVPVLWRIMLLGVLEVVLDQGFFSVGIVYTSASYTSAIFNSLPSITFLMAVILRIEQVRIKEGRSQAKVIGTVITFGGALLMAIYKGRILVGSSNEQSHENSTNGNRHRWILGTVFLFVSCVAFSAFYVLQSAVLRIYPAAMTLSCLICFLGTLEIVGVVVALEHNPHEWALGWDSRLFAPLYAGVVTTGITFYVQGVVMRARGPVFVTAFYPLRVIIVTILAIPMLHETLYLGSIIGNVVILIGVYAVIWGKGKDLDSQQSTTETRVDPEQKQLPVTMPPTTTTDTAIEPEVKPAT